MSRMHRRRALATLLGGAGWVSAPGLVRAQGPAPAGAQALVEVWKSPTCGCCKDWMTHLQAPGFRVKAHDVGNTAARTRLKVPAQLGSCHTARVGGYAIEGHVPAADIVRLLKERPQAIGLAVPGMPIGSPGMDGPAYGNRQEPYDVLLIAQDGSTRVFSSYFKAKARV
jgi:hypothetical protein